MKMIIHPVVDQHVQWWDAKVCSVASSRWSMAWDVRYRVCLEAVQATNISEKKKLKRGARNGKSGLEMNVILRTRSNFRGDSTFHQRSRQNEKVSGATLGRFGSYLLAVENLTCACGDL